ncbi:MAG: hypothetical protein GC185_06060 [Alphaproteobacteria bacterium]|nr:hypothetical protein [Alphaproteobacteria bacterium]
MKKIAVMYLCRFGNPPHFSRNFLKDVIRFRAGVEFDLVYILKGFPEGVSDKAFLEIRKELPCDSYEVRVSDDLFITSAHLGGAEQVDHEMVLPLTSWSNIHCDQWLSPFVSAFDKIPDCAISGATGSFESLDDKTPFPNIHIRTTAFLLNRNLFVSAERGELKTKYDNNLMEAGPNGLTRQMLNRNKRVAVVGKGGQIWEPRDWAKSLTFRAGYQENLIISDNRTHAYDVSKQKKRLRLARMAWGEEINVPPVNIFRRLKDTYHWKFG